RPGVARAGLVLRHPAVAPLLVRVLQGGHCRPMRALAVAVLLDGGVMCLRERPLRLPPGPLQGVRELGAPDLVSLRHLRHAFLLSAVLRTADARAGPSSTRTSRLPGDGLC